jgi:regulation of enolase protein 1 (concanavalin A-like superfamily)
MQWLNEPVSWQRTGDTLTVSVDAGTDFWRETGYGYIRDSGHVYGEVLAGDLDLSVRVRGAFATQYDQAGVMLRVDDRVWLKTGLELFEGRPRLSTVLTLGRSSWVVTDLPEGTSEVTLRVARRGDAVEVRYQLLDGPDELAALLFLPAGREVLAGVMCASPEGPGFSVTFSGLQITGRPWAEAAGAQPAQAGPGLAVAEAVAAVQPAAPAAAWQAVATGEAPAPAAAWTAGEDGGLPGQGRAEGEGPGVLVPAENVPAPFVPAEDVLEPCGPAEDAAAAIATGDPGAGDAGAGPAQPPLAGPGMDPASDWDLLAVRARVAGGGEHGADASEHPADASEHPAGGGQPPAKASQHPEPAGPPDPAEEWISLLTTDPADD